MPNPWVRAVAGGAALLVMTLLSGTRAYNGAGMGVLAAALEHGAAHPLAFLLKLAFTAVTLGAGFKGGEVVPSFFVGATFGAALGPVLGIPAGFAAAVVKLLAPLTFGVYIIHVHHVNWTWMEQSFKGLDGGGYEKAE